MCASRAGRSVWPVVLAAAGMGAAIYGAVAVWSLRRNPAPAPVTAILRDAGQSLGLDARGKLSGVAGLPEQESITVAAVLGGGRLPFAQPRAELQVKGGAA